MRDVRCMVYDVVLTYGDSSTGATEVSGLKYVTAFSGKSLGVRYSDTLKRNIAWQRERIPSTKWIYKTPRAALSAPFQESSYGYQCTQQPRCPGSQS